MPTSLAFPGKLRAYWFVCESVLVHQWAMFWHVHVFSRQLLPGWRKERPFYLGCVGVNTEYRHLFSRDLSEDEFSSRVIRAAEHTNDRKREHKTGNIKVFFLWFERICLRIMLCTCYCYKPHGTNLLEVRLFSCIHTGLNVNEIMEGTNLKLRRVSLLYLWKTIDFDTDNANV